MSRRPRPAGREGQPARRAALTLFLSVLDECRPLAEEEPVLAPLPPADRARARRLVLGAFRGLARADALLAPRLQRRPPPAALAALRLGTVELAQGGAAHGVVNDWVQVVAGAGRKPAAARGMVNAVLRQMAQVAPAQWDALPVPALPDWLRAPMVAAWGEAAAAGIEAAHLAGAPLDITPKGDAAALAARLGGEVLPTGSVRLSRGAQVSALPGYAEGEWWVQDAAAALPARALAARPGERVLDLCAAPGGKTMQLAATGAEVTALDLSPARLERVAANLARTGLSARLLAGDARDHAGGPYDAILLDAPCSATGTIRRHPELPHIRDGSGLPDLVQLQAQMIDRAAALLAPGGRLVCCTCSLLPEEGEAQVAAALARHPALRPDPDALCLPGVQADWIGAQGLRLRPDYWAELGGMDGFFVAALRRVA
ncbi:RsmB/NOP family class I SAM-dependent RNA methyltransferase [Rhodosalinus sp.]|uniref:RsmB/NOP family class I SAM-dependent RNA methyltransferase n=1 Tax=Rhodosalinus sp. TaxID=2047741 RepID=UPI003979F1EC